MKGLNLEQNDVSSLSLLIVCTILNFLNRSWAPKVSTGGVAAYQLGNTSYHMIDESGDVELNKP